MEIQEQDNKNRIIVRSFNQIQIEPSPINSIFYCKDDNNIYLSRQRSSEVYHVVKSQQNQNEVQFQHIARLPFSKHIVKVNNILLLFLPFQLRLFNNNSWQVHNFTTQLLSINVKKISPTKSIIYSFHEQQTVEYKLSSEQDDEQFVMKHLAKGKTPYHITKQNAVEGFGKRIAAMGKANSFTVCEWKDKDYIIVGDAQGAVHIYDYRTLGHLKTFKKHLGPVLTIKIDQNTDTFFYSGSDSKIVAAQRVDGQWTLSSQIRGQSHDIFSLQLVHDNILVSGGLTTDLCCYPLYKQKQILKNYINKISYRSESVVHSMKNYLLINKINSFQLWKIRETEGDLQFLVRYQLPQQKYIKDIKISKRLADKTHLIIVSTQLDTVGWKFSQVEGLSKLFTIQNSYQHIQFLTGKNIFIGLRDSGQIQKVYCKTGKIDQITSSDVNLPTDMKLIGLDKLVVASNLSNVIKVFDLKKKALISKCNLTQIYQVLTQKSQNQFLIKYVQDKNLYSCNFQKKTIQQTQLFALPQTSGNIRYGGVIVHQSQMTKNLKKYWFFANQNKVFIINNLNAPNKRKVVRSIYTRQVGTIIKPRINKAFQLGVVHFNFKRMINNMQIKPLLAKKIV